MLKIIRLEKPGQFRALNCFYDANCDLEGGYKAYMQKETANMSFNGFCDLAIKFNWMERCNKHRDGETLRLSQEKRWKQLENGCTAEDVAKTLYLTCLERIELTKGSMEHKDIAKYLDIANTITINPKSDPMVVVNQAQSQGVVEIDPKILKEIGKKLIIEE